MNTPLRRGKPRLDQQFNILVSGLERESFDEAAALAGLSLSAWARTRLRDYAKAELESSGRSVPFLETRV